jgi:ABC-2 type transport system permease protein
MRSILRACKSEVAFLLGNPSVLFIILIAPIGYPFFYNYLYVHKFETDVPVAAVDFDRSASSRALLRALDATQQVMVTGVAPDLDEARRALESGKAQGIVVIPQGFSFDLANRKRAVIRSYINTTRFMVAVDISKGLGDAVLAMGNDVRVRAFSAAGFPRARAEALSDPLVLRTESLANTLESYGDFIIPAILLLILQQSLFVGTAVASAQAQKRQQAFSRMNIGWVAGYVGRGLPYFLLYAVYSLAFFTVQYHLWHIPFSGNVLLLSALVAALLCSTIAAGFFVGSLFSSHLSTLLVTMFSSYPMFLLSGVAWPVESMPPLLRVLRQGLLSTHFYPVALATARLNAPAASVLPHIAALAAIGAASAALLAVRMKLLLGPEKA